MGEVEEEEEEGEGMRAKRCLEFVATMERSSGNETFRERRRGQESCGLEGGQVRLYEEM